LQSNAESGKEAMRYENYICTLATRGQT